ncbi:hypothetical protein MPSEU_000862800 [Mayamaea pseudoterrestris]|nr:hypothetical protein MPSEU_000862800 [Mayamaea pseudoterrestris]
MATIAAMFTIGSRVRVPLEGTKAYRRGIIATIQDDGTASVLLEEAAPPPASFVSKPKQTITSINEEEAEMTVPMSDIKPLFDFELYDKNSDKDASVSLALWKERGDRLLKLGDALAAMEYYQGGLVESSSQFSVGSVVIIKQKGFTKLAEVDCMEDDGDSLDVSLVFDGAEATIRLSQVVLGVSSADSDRLQERMLLNLARCCLQAADIIVLKQRPLYIRCAVFACTLAMDVSQYYDGYEGPATSTMTTALVLRSKAQIMASKFDHAKADLKRLLSVDPQHAEANRLMRQLERTIQQNKVSEKKLVKELCKWVDVATSQSTKL